MNRNAKYLLIIQFLFTLKRFFLLITDCSLQKVIKFKAGFRALQHIWKYNLFSCMDPVQDGEEEGITASSD